MSLLGRVAEALDMLLLVDFAPKHPKRGRAVATVLRQGFALRAEVGPAMRTIRSTDDPQVWQDAGLNPNAQEFRDNHTPRLAEPQ